MSAPATEAPLPAPASPELPYGTVVVLQAVLQLLVFGSAMLPWDHGKSALELASRDTGASAFGALHFGGPLIAAVVAGSRRLRGHTPGKGAFWLLSSFDLLKVIALLLAGATFVMHRRNTESMALLAVGVTLVALTAWPLWHGSRTEGWRRWSFLQAAMAPWHLLVASVLLVEVGHRSPAPGIWLYLLAAPALAPLYGWVMWQRRKG